VRNYAIYNIEYGEFLCKLAIIDVLYNLDGKMMEERIKFDEEKN
jgi:hypothetical protein